MRSTTSRAFGIRSVRGAAMGLFAAVALLAGCFSPAGTTTSSASSTGTGGTTTGGTGTTGGTVTATTTEVTSDTPTTTGATTATATTGVETSSGTTGLTLTGVLTETTTGLTDTTLTTLTTLDSTSTGAPPFCGDGVVTVPQEECDDGNLTNDDGCDDQCAVEWRYVFVTSASYAGTLIGGALGGDAKCKMLAAGSNNGLLDGREFKAWLSTGMMHAKDRIGNSTVPYRLTDGTTQVAANTAALLGGMLDSPINLDESQGIPLETAEVWTGTLASGAAAPEHCSGWSLRGMNGMVGTWIASDSAWTESAELDCAMERRIYCIEVPQ